MREWVELAPAVPDLDFESMSVTTAHYANRACLDTKVCMSHDVADCFVNRNHDVARARRLNIEFKTALLHYDPGQLQPPRVACDSDIYVVGHDCPVAL